MLSANQNEPPNSARIACIESDLPGHANLEVHRQGDVVTLLVLNDRLASRNGEWEPLLLRKDDVSALVAALNAAIR